MDCSALSKIFREVFQGVEPGKSGTWFVEKHEGIFDALETLTAEQASKSIPGQHSTIGSHVRHLGYYLTLFNANLREEIPTSDWPSSWKIIEFSAEEWLYLAHSVHKEFDFAFDWYQNGSFSDGEQATYAVANIAHAAYHLGAIRALIPLVV